MALGLGHRACSLGFLGVWGLGFRALGIGTVYSDFFKSWAFGLRLYGLGLLDYIDYLTPKICKIMALNP